MEEAEKRDHRKLGKELDLYTTSTLVGRCGTMERLETVVQPAAGGHLRRTPMKLSAVFSRFMQRF